MPEPALAGLAALDLTDQKGLFCGRILADHGVDVTQIEPPCGSNAREYGPFYHDVPGPENSLYWQAFCANKRSITLNLENETGRNLFGRLVRDIDIVIESFHPGYLDGLGLGYEQIVKLNPSIIFTSITPFGQTGPYAEYRASDLVCWSLGGYTWMVGDSDRPPVGISFPQAYLHGAAEAAVATLIALYHRLVTGKGQHIDVSVQASVARDLMNAPLFWEINKVILRRSGPYRVGLTIGGRQRLHWKCKDGYVTYLLIGGATGARDNRNLSEFMDSLGACPDFMKGIDWKQFDMSSMSQALIDKYDEAIQSFFLRFTKAELYQEGIKRNFTVYPVATVADISNEQQLKERGFWELPADGEFEGMLLPGAPIKLSETPCAMRHRAPTIGEHNEDVFRRLGINPSELQNLKEAGVI